MRLHINSIDGKIYSNITLEESGSQLIVKAKQQTCNTTNFIFIDWKRW